jgi:flagellar basal body-associated protein FliL
MEASVPLPDRQSPEHRGIDWPAVIRILLLQMLVLMALAGAFVGYVNWSSEQALSEFAGASEGSALAPYRQPQTQAAVRAAKDQASCKR